LDFREFIKEFTVEFRAMEERDLLERFKGYDMDGDGKISVQDLKDNFLKYGDQLD